MSDEQVVTLLEEIRDLQKEYLANQRLAIQNQQESLVRQNSALERSKISYIILIVILAFLGISFLGLLLSWLFGWLVRR